MVSIGLFLTTHKLLVIKKVNHPEYGKNCKYKKAVIALIRSRCFIQFDILLVQKMWVDKVFFNKIREMFQVMLVNIYNYRSNKFDFGGGGGDRQTQEGLIWMFFKVYNQSQSKSQELETQIVQYFKTIHSFGVQTFRQLKV